MSSGEPASEEIYQFLEISNYTLSKDECVRRLKNHDNNLGNAINEWMNDPSSDKYTWQESQFSADRQGETKDAGISFNIQGPDEMAINGYHGSAAPTRPPSRTNNKSPLGAPTSTAQEDADLRKALADSMADSGIELAPPPQETGVVDDLSGTHFGPANRPVYDTSQWAMVPTKSSAQVVSPDPSPSLRKRKPGAPAFLSQATGTHRLGAILTILHSIPLARNILLRIGTPAPSYGHHNQWWKGEPIKMPDAQISSGEAPESPGSEAYPPFGEEVHRLMAFLDQTERSYGSVDVLAQTNAMCSGPGDLELQFFELLQYESIANPDSGLGAMMMKGRTFPVAPQLRGAVEDSAPEDKEQTLAIVELSLEPEQSKSVNSLYDALDQLLWTSALSTTGLFPDKAEFAVLMKPADILSFRFSGAGMTKPCDIPAEFYADRYTHDRKDLAIHFQRQIFELKRNGIQQLRQWQQNATKCQDEKCLQSSWLGQSHDVRSCCERTIYIAQEILRRQKQDAQWRHFDGMWHKNMTYSMSDLESLHTGGGPVDFTTEEDRQRIFWERTIKSSSDKLDQVNQEVAGCHERLKAYQEALGTISKRLTCQQDEAMDSLYVFKSDPTAYHPEYWNPTHKYFLRGVVLSEILSYVCIRGEPDLMDMDVKLPPDDQWWKTSRPTIDSANIDFERVTEDDVLIAAGTGAQFPLFIYASEAALNTPSEPLSDALRMFTRADNRSFQQELAQENRQQQPEPKTEHPQMKSEEMEQARWFTNERRASNCSSAATNGSRRSTISDLSLRKEPESIEGVRTSHDEFPAPGKTELSGRTEMQERAGGGGHLSLLARPGNITSQSAPIDMVDIDMDPDRKGG